MSAIIKSRGRILPPQKFPDGCRVRHLITGQAGKVLRYRPFAPMTKGCEPNPYLIAWDGEKAAWSNPQDLEEIS